MSELAAGAIHGLLEGLISGWLSHHLRRSARFADLRCLCLRAPTRNAAVSGGDPRWRSADLRSTLSKKKCASLGSAASPSCACGVVLRAARGWLLSPTAVPPSGSSRHVIDQCSCRSSRRQAFGQRVPAIGRGGLCSQRTSASHDAAQPKRGRSEASDQTRVQWVRRNGARKSSSPRCGQPSSGSHERRYFLGFLSRDRERIVRSPLPRRLKRQRIGALQPCPRPHIASWQRKRVRRPRASSS